MERQADEPAPGAEGRPGASAGSGELRGKVVAVGQREGSIMWELISSIYRA